MAAPPPHANPITLLQAPTLMYGGLNLPTGPQRPPTDQDVVDSYRFLTRTAERHRKSKRVRNTTYSHFLLQAEWRMNQIRPSL